MAMVTGFEDMLAGSLNLREPWYIERAEFDSEKREKSMSMSASARTQKSRVLGAAAKLSGTGMNPMNASGDMQIVCFIRAMYTTTSRAMPELWSRAGKRKARGFHTFEGFASVIYLVVGKLQLAVPDPFII